MDAQVEPEKHRQVEAFYARAASEPSPSLCCPQAYAREWTDHIPAEALEYNYGCGSPLTKAGIRPGEVVLDLGSGVGIDCFVAARQVGERGRVIGVDMTDAMVDRARGYQPQVAAHLGYDVVEFRRGTIEALPLSDRSVDVVVSNCVLNLSPAPAAVLGEIHRVLAHAGRVVISDVVSDREIDAASRSDPTLWSECHSGARPAGELVRSFAAAGLVGVTQLDERPWDEVAGYRFASLTLAAYKFDSSDRCRYAGQMAVYLGPYASVADEEGHVFPRFQPVEVCTDTAARLSGGPYAGAFIVIEAGEGTADGARGPCCDEGAGAQTGGCCEPGGSGCC